MKKIGSGILPDTAYAIIKCLLMMKLAILLIVLMSAQSFANSYGQNNINLKLEKVQLKKALKAIENQGFFRFVYKDEILPKDKRVSIEVHDASLDEVLEKILQTTSLTYRRLTDNLVVITDKQPADRESAAAAISVAGKIANEKGEALSGVSVLEKGTNNGTRSKDDGSFSLEVTNARAVLVFSFIGYRSQEVSLNGKTQLSVTLQLESSQLNDVVVIGYGSRQKKDVTGAVSSINATDIEKSTAPTSELAMQGRMPGVLVTTPSGNPNDRVEVRIRGVNTFSGVNDPLYVVDGIPITEGGLDANPATEAVLIDLRTPINIFTLIDPSDIESISILKDASAAAIYGVRASNGVVLITTKRGKFGKPKVELNGYYGIQNMVAKKVKLLNTQQFVDLYKEAYAAYPRFNNGVPQTFGEVFGPEFDESSPKYLGNSPTYDWQSALLNKNAPAANLNLKISGASDAFNYYVSGGYYSSEGTLLGSKLTRYSLTSNFSAKISKVVEVGLNTRLVYEKNTNEGAADLSTTFTAPPWQPIYGNGPNGYAPTAAYQFMPNPDFDPTKIDAGPIKSLVTDPTLLWGQQTKFNPFGSMSLNHNVYNQYNTLGNGYIQISPVKGLKIKGTLAGNFWITKNTNLAGFDGYLFSQTPGNPYTNVRDSNIIATSNIRNTTQTSYTKELSATYNTSFGDHNIELTAVANEQIWDWKIFSASASLTSLHPVIESSTTIANPQRGSETTLRQRGLIGYIGRLSYKYADKYYLDVSVRRDGSSHFAPEHRWGTFPAAAVAWRISSEKFFQGKGVKWINDLKIRANWGQLGNEQNTAGFAYLSLVNPGITMPNYSFGSGNGNGVGTPLTGAWLPGFANQKLSWETLTTTGAGFDAILFNNKLNFTFEYYYKKNKDIIQAVAPPPSTGIEIVPDINVGTVQNKGIELQVGYNDNIGPVNFNVSANFTTVSNRVVKLNGGNPFTSAIGQKIREGYPIGFIEGFKLGGIFQDQKQIDDWRAAHADIIVGQSLSDPSTGYQPRPGDMYFQDVHGQPLEHGAYNNKPDSLIDNSDQTYLGKTIPGYYYGFNLGASYKGFELSAFFQGVGDVQKYDWARAGGESMSSNGVNQWASVLNRWTDQNHSSTIPRAVFTDPNQNNRVSSRFVENAGFLRLKNIQLGYNLPKSLLRKIGLIQNLGFYISATNLFTITNYKGLDPENDLYPPAKQIIFGFTAAF